MPLYLAVLFLMTGVGLLGSYLALELTMAGKSEQVIGLVMSFFFIGMLVGAYQCHKLISSVGHIRAFAVFAAITTAVVMLHGMHTSPVFWGLLRFVSGVSITGLYMVVESWLNESAQPQLRGKVLALYMVISYLGMGLGQQLLNLGNSNGIQLFYVAGFTLTLCLVPVAVTHSLHPRLPEIEKLHPLQVLIKAPAGVSGCFLAGLLNSAFYSLVPVFCYQTGFSVMQLSLVMTMAIFGGMLFQWPIGTISDRYDRTYVLIIQGITLTFVSLTIMFLTNLFFPLFLALMVLYGGISFTLYPVAVARTHDVFAARNVVPVSSVLLLFYGLGASAGPVLASSAMTITASPYGLFAYFTCMAAIYSLITYILRRREAISIIAAENSTEFVALKSTSPVAAVMSPLVDNIEVEKPPYEEKN